MYLHFRTTFYLLIASAMLTGCSVCRIDSQDTTSDYYPPKKSSQEVMYQPKIDHPNEIIGTVIISVDNGTTYDDVILKMKNEAALLGGDAITGIVSSPEGIIRTRYTGKVAVLK
ncbi:MAG: hypothetical protein HQL22_07030 [Candidatus Omnitrophica bacterium]|nr:hypothetical protein [Candidatus Omnitrophota bacterium]